MQNKIPANDKIPQWGIDIAFVTVDLWAVDISYQKKGVAENPTRVGINKQKLNKMKKLIKKLSLNKMTISNLNVVEMESMVGGNLLKPKLTKITNCKTFNCIQNPDSPMLTEY